MKRRFFFFAILCFFIFSSQVFPYFVEYKEQYYKLYHIHYEQAPDDIVENIYWLERAINADFCNPIHALGKITTKKEWEKYRYMFMMHLNLKMVEQHLRLGSKYDKQAAYFYNYPWKEQNIESLSKAEEFYEAALVYWHEAKLWAEKANMREFQFLFLDSLPFWENERARIASGDLNYERTIKKGAPPPSKGQGRLYEYGRYYLLIFTVYLFTYIHLFANMVNMDRCFKLSPSLLSADFSKLGEELAFIEKNGCDWVHIDVMDGQFVPNLTFGAPVVKSIRPCSKLVFDVHLMVNNPENLVSAFADAGADYFTFHAEASIHADRLIADIRSHGMKAGVSIVPSTPVGMLEEIAPLADLILVMSVNPGFGGQKLIPYCLEKVKRLRSLREEKNYNYLISVDGGIDSKNVGLVIDAGADVIVSGSAFFSGDLRI